MQSTARSYSGLQKQAVREKVITSGRVYKNIILLAGEKCRTVEFMLQQGNINKYTVVTVIERNSSVLEKIKKRFRQYPFIQVNFSHTEVENTPDHGPYDFMDLDTCSTLSASILNWVAQQRFLPDADVAMWFTAYRSSQIFKDTLTTNFLKTRAGIRVVSDMRDNMTDVCYTYAPIHLVSSAAIYTALSRYSCIVKPVLTYSEHVNFMYVYRFTNLNRLVHPRPSLDEILVTEVVSEQQVWPHSDRQIFAAGDPLMAMCLKVVGGSTPQQRAYVTGQLRREIKSGQLAGKDPKWIRAGWKSHLTKVIKDKDTRIKAHQFIDNL